MRWITALFLMTSAAAAQTWVTTTSIFGSQSSSVACTYGDEAWQEVGPYCHFDKRLRVLAPNTLVGSTGTAISTHAPQCPDGYMLVYTGRPMCARDLIEPK